MSEEKERAWVFEGVGTVDDAWITIEEASACSYHTIPLGFSREDIEKVFYCQWSNQQEYADTDSTTVFRLKNGKYVLAHEWGDSSGHG
jgi:hypothetical protein